MGSDWDVEASLRMIVGRFEQGVITRNELIDQIVGCASHPRCFEYFGILNAKIRQLLKEQTFEVPGHPEDFLPIHGPGYYGSEVDEEAIVRDIAFRIESYWRLRRVREYFHPTLPPPEFQVMHLTGKVDDAVEMEGSIVIFGVYAWLIRRNPIHLVQPDGTRIVTTVVGYDYFVRDDDRDLKFEFQRKCGRHGVFLGNNVRSVEEVPVGTEVWIDRSGAGGIPPRPEGW